MGDNGSADVCECDGTRHSPSVHTVQDSLGGGGGGAPAATKAVDVDVYVNVDGLARGGHVLFESGDTCKQRVDRALARVEELEAGLLAGHDETGRAFHDDGENPGYDSLSTKLKKSSRDVPEGIRTHGYLAEVAAKAYADADDQAGARTGQYRGVWGT
jgi:hypothetical protein